MHGQPTPPILTYLHGGKLFNTPQQLGVAVMNGTQIKVIRAALKIERASDKVLPYAHVALDLKNVHNEFNRQALRSKITRIKVLRSKALEATNKIDSPPESEVFDV